MNINFDKNGLIPAVIQDFYTGEVLMVAYMNEESLQISLEEKKTCFFSRSRGELWRKGETSGNTQHIVSIESDCDADTLLIKVIKNGPACHNGTNSCFTDTVYRDDEAKSFSVDALYELLAGRKKELPEGSYTTYLFEKGKEKILKKVGEECTEVIIGAMKDDKKETVYEIADLCYHVLVLMVESGIHVDDIRKELASRSVIEKKKKQ